MKYYFLYNGGKIYYSDSGSGGDAIVFLHGYLETSDIWAGFSDKFSGDYRIISVDLPGHGLSKVYGECHSMEFMAGAVRDLLDNLGIRQIILIGHSLGGYITLAFAELYPEMLKAFCLFHSHPFADTEQTRQKRGNEIKVVRSGKRYLIYPESVSMMYAPENLLKMKEAVQRSKDIASCIREEGMVAVLNGMMIRPSRISVLENGKVPYLWILGKKDNYISSEDVLQKVRIPSGSKAFVLENSGHMGFIEESEASAAAIQEFIKSIL
jgi:pimeloyl-ACP methyl ester carboxylesterase